MEATGEDLAGDHWIRTLLNNTMAMACVNGHTSNLHLFGAGIRRGGVESPGVYLFIAWALNLWLRECPAVGNRVGELLRGDQFADDSHPFLKSLKPEVAGQFLSAMKVLGLASNQHLNCDKSKLLPVGDWSTDAPLPQEDLWQRCVE
jgi:hypothetical protein